MGIFIHWGLFSVPSYGGGKSGCEWFWENWVGRKDPWIVHFMQRNYLKTFTYPNFGPQFKAELFDPQKWVDLFERAGAKWVHSMHTLRGVTMVLCVCAGTLCSLASTTRDGPTGLQTRLGTGTPWTVDLREILSVRARALSTKKIFPYLHSAAPSVLV